MKRAILNLYFVIVITVVATGAGLDAIWSAIEEDNPDPRFQHYLLLVEQQLLILPAEEHQQALLNIEKALGFRVELLSPGAFAETSLADRLADGEVIHMDQGGDGFSYKRLTGSDQVISLRYPLVTASSSTLRTLLTAVFYLAIAAGVMFWVLPVSRDLNIVERHIQQLGEDNLNQGSIKLAHNSAILYLAQAFNQMTLRIRHLVQSQKDMTHAISHELRTPLARMKFALEMAQSQGDMQLVRQKLDSIRLDVTEMEVLINELLDYAALEQSSQIISLQAGDLPALAEQVVHNKLATGARVLDIRVSNRLAHPQVRADWRLLERALLNLVQNATRYARSRIEIVLITEQAEIVIHVDDDGPGIPVSDRDLVFDSFVRLRHGIASSGFGLGLAIVRNIAAKHGGSIVVEDSPLGGARFTFCWPGCVASPVV